MEEEEEEGSSLERSKKVIHSIRDEIEKRVAGTKETKTKECAG